jgi:type VI secretion system protein ImpC
MADSPEKQQQEAGAAEAVSGSFLDSVLEATPAAAPDEAKSLVENLVKGAMEGTITFDKSLTNTINQAIAAIDAKLSVQLAAIMQNAEFQKLEGTWRGFHYLVSNSETSAQLKIRVFNVSKKELQKDLEKAVDFDQSQLFQKLYEQEYGMAGGEPYGALIGDYEFTSHPEDLDMLEKISGVAASAFCPFISAAGPEMFGFKDYQELSKPRDLERIFQSAQYTRWKSFRDSEDSRFVTLTMPRVLSRLPYGSTTKSIEEFNFEEVGLDKAGQTREVDHNKFTWMNAAYVLGARLTDSFAKHGWCMAIRGLEGGGKVEGLPTYTFTSEDGDLDAKCPTEIGITDRREAELSKLGFLPLCHYKNTDYAVFFGGQTTQKPKQYDKPAATANAEISARLPYMLASSRIAHYLKCIARDHIGTLKERSDMEDFLKNWIANYVSADPKPKDDVKYQYPLAEAAIEVREVPGKPGAYEAIAHLRPWLFFEELTTSLRMVASLPQKKS